MRGASSESRPTITPPMTSNASKRSPTGARMKPRIPPMMPKTIRKIPKMIAKKNPNSPKKRRNGRVMIQKSNPNSMKGIASSPAKAIPTAHRNRKVTILFAPTGGASKRFRRNRNGLVAGNRLVGGGHFVEDEASLHFLHRHTLSLMRNHAALLHR